MSERTHVHWPPFDGWIFLHFCSGPGVWLMQALFGDQVLVSWLQHPSIWNNGIFKWYNWHTHSCKICLSTYDFGRLEITWIGRLEFLLFWEPPFRKWWWWKYEYIYNIYIFSTNVNKVTKTTKGVEVVVDTVASRQDHQKYNIFQKCKKKNICLQNQSRDGEPYIHPILNTVRVGAVGESPRFWI